MNEVSSRRLTRGVMVETLPRPLVGTDPLSRLFLEPSRDGGVVTATKTA
jgi:hypothetical protein